MEGRKKPSRSEIISETELNLSAIKPLERLKEFTSIGKYRYQFHWDKFKNGVMMEGKIYYIFKGKMRTLTKEARWVPTLDIETAKMVISACILQNLGLGFDEPEEENLTDISFKAVSSIFKSLSEKSWADQTE